MQEAQFDELCGLQQIAVSWVIYSCSISFAMCLHSYTNLKFHAIILIYMTRVFIFENWIVIPMSRLLVKVLHWSVIYIAHYQAYTCTPAFNKWILGIQAQLPWWVCDKVLQIGQHYIPSIYSYFYSFPLIAHIFASHGKACKLSVYDNSSCFSKGTPN